MITPQGPPPNPSSVSDDDEALRALTDGTPAIMWVTDAAGNIQFLNRAYCEFFGATLEQVRSQGWQPLVHPEDVSAYVEPFLAAAAAHSPFRAQGRVRRADGAWRWIDSHGLPRFSPSGEFMGMAGSSLDITDRVEAEEKLRLSEERFRISLHRSGVTVFSMDAGLRYTWVYNPHPHFCAVDMLGKNDAELFSPTDAAVLTALKSQVLASGQEMRQELTLTFGGELNHVDLFLSPTRTPGGEIDGLLGSALDITALKNSEAASREFAAQLQASNQDLENFAFIASHDLKEPLRKIVSFSDLIARNEHLTETERDYLARMRASAHRMQNLITALLALSRSASRKGACQPVDLNRIAKNVLEDLEHMLRQTKGQIILHPLPTVEADPVQMHQLIQNLLANALKFHRPDVAPQVQLSSRTTADARIELTIADNGTGFDMAKVDEIFKPFGRLHPRSRYEGSGIGLVICKKIAERHGGSITAHSVPGEGSTFIVQLKARSNGR
jgi:two-component system, LuxR family, sensor kinase FixL